MKYASFNPLSPHVILHGIELSHGLSLEESLTPYHSYVNRVYGLRDLEGHEYIAKFYRPGRWSEDGILEEHQLIIDCVNAEIPVAAPIPDPDGHTLGEITAVDDNTETDYYFALFPKKGGRLFDAENDEAWLRMGSLLGRLHMVGRTGKAEHRAICTPAETTALHIENLLHYNLVHPELEESFEKICREILKEIGPLFDNTKFLRLHGDCHRGNILDRSDEGLLLIDFDDMMIGPAVQDMWLLLPDYVNRSRRELNLLLEGYEEFMVFDQKELRLIEPLRFMRIIHYIAWCARQRDDKNFQTNFPDWGSRGYWIKEVEDITLQGNVIRESLTSAGLL